MPDTEREERRREFDDLSGEPTRDSCNRDKDKPAATDQQLEDLAQEPRRSREDSPDGQSPI